MDNTSGLVCPARPAADAAVARDGDIDTTSAQRSNASLGRRSSSIFKTDIAGSPLVTKLVILFGILLFLQLAFQSLLAMWSASSRASAIALGLASVSSTVAGTNTTVDLKWHPPSQTAINNLTSVLNGSGVYGFIYNTSSVPDSSYGTYNWCNMPHVRKQEYPRPPAGFELAYVEVIHRHHKRTPYASNSFPVEPYRWNCDDEGLYYYAAPQAERKTSADSYWQGHISPVNPFTPSGWIGTCQFPQITAAGLDDSFQHGADLYAVYHDLLGFLPARDGDAGKWREKVTYRVTNNVITSQVAGMLIAGMWGSSAAVPLIIESSSVDSLEPVYSCAVSSSLFNSIKSSANAAWEAHLTAAKPLYATLDDISGVAPMDSGFHASFDHYYDNLSARQCHTKPLPCKLVDGVNSTTECVTQELADEVYRLGNWEYSRIYRDSEAGFAASYLSFGVWLAELAAHVRAVVAGTAKTIWFHNIAHDGSVSRLLAVLQVDVMVWPGMGSEVLFEVYRRREGSGAWGSGYYVRVLWGGKVLVSSNPSLGTMDMLPVETLLAYIDGLVGVNASLVVGKCNGSISL